jgi:hypothetical protein
MSYVYKFWDETADWLPCEKCQSWNKNYVVDYFNLCADCTHEQMEATNNAWLDFMNEEDQRNIRAMKYAILYSYMSDGGIRSHSDSCRLAVTIPAARNYKYISWKEIARRVNAHPMEVSLND